MTKIIEVKTEKAPKAIGPYSQAVKANGLLFCSGQIGIIPQTGELINDDIASQAKQIFYNIKEILNASGLSLDCIIRVEVYLTRIEKFALINEIYEDFFKDINPKPARQTVEVSALPKKAKIEISCIAIAN